MKGTGNKPHESDEICLKVHNKPEIVVASDSDFSESDIFEKEKVSSFYSESNDSMNAFW